MPRRRAASLIVIVAALAWAPSSVSAATPAVRSSSSAPRPVATPAPSPPASDAPATGRDDRDLGLFVLVGTLAIGAVALVGTAWVILAGRRDRRAASGPVEPPPSDPSEIATAIIEQRARRHARLRAPDDPIVAAMGLPQEDAAPGAGAVQPAPPRRAPRSGGRSRRRAG
jgi:hypothetical protein